MTVKIAVLGTYPPTQCGIATFARSLSSAIAGTGQDVRIVRLGNGGGASNSSRVIAEHRSRQDLSRTVNTLNSHDIVILQHEFGIYDGEDGEEVLDILGDLKVPVITVLHTVTAQPTSRQRRIMQGLLNGSNSVVTLSNSALRTLVRSHDVDMRRVRVIPHGAPKFSVPERGNAMRMRPRILTWGLLGEGKGIEWGIEALAQIHDVDVVPDYFIVGQTHPKVVEREGYRYRNRLGQLAEEMGVGNRVHFMDGYLDSASLARVITSADIFLLPYDTRDQVTSGVLAEAMVAGGPIIATRFPHAVELLGDGTGALVDHQNPSSIAAAMRRLILQPRLRHYMRELTRRKARNFLWPAVGSEFSQLAHVILHAEKIQLRRAAASRDLEISVGVPA
jgi:polysaccharide biosynthesis protein PslF